MALTDSGESELRGIRDDFLWASETKFSGTEMHIVLLEKTLTMFVVKIYWHSNCSLCGMDGWEFFWLLKSFIG
jgi:hypothetical protein